MNSLIDGLLFSWGKNSDYAEQLVSDLSDEQMTAQPAPEGKAPANHPAWVLSHLNVYLPIVEKMLDGESFEDPKGHQFGMESKPEADATIYAPKAELISSFVTGHQRVAEKLRQADPSVLENEIVLERWKPVFPKVGNALPYLMLLHENGHLGQISAWRRIQGMPSV